VRDYQCSVVCAFLFTLTASNDADRFAPPVTAMPAAQASGRDKVEMGDLLLSFLWSYEPCLSPVGLPVEAVRWQNRECARHRSHVIAWRRDDRPRPHGDGRIHVPARVELDHSRVVSARREWWRTHDSVPARRRDSWFPPLWFRAVGLAAALITAGERPSRSGREHDRRRSIRRRVDRWEMSRNVARSVADSHNGE
jgi:hypothetical protein